jgi:hypothetical protein
MMRPWILTGKPNTKPSGTNYRDRRHVVKHRLIALAEQIELWPTDPLFQEIEQDIRIAAALPAPTSVELDHVVPARVRAELLR